MKMPSLVLLCMLAGAFWPAVADIPDDDLGFALKSCGKPVRIKQLPAAKGMAERFIRKDVYYKKVDIIFMRDDPGYWTMVAAFRAGGDRTIDKAETVKLLPCLAEVNYQDKLY